MFDTRYSIRSYRSGDITGILKLWELTGLGSTERGDNEEIIEKSIEMGGMFQVVESPSMPGIIGTCWTTFDGRRLHLHHLGIHPDHRRKGLAKKLTKESMTFAKDRGIQIKLEVHRSNQEAVSLYKGFGFKYLGDYDVYIIRDLNQIELNDP
jgi:ribosomal protein S18 acetylase RimI-like enzyme